MDKIKCLRIYSDPQGESHFGETEVAFKTTNYAPPAPPFDVSSPFPATRFLLASTPPGYFGDLHPTPCRQLGVMLIGELEVQASDGDVKHLRPGNIVLVEDTTGKGHRSRVVGQEAGLILFVHMPN